MRFIDGLRKVRTFHGEHEYLVAWEGYESEENEWMTEARVDAWDAGRGICQDDVEHFRAAHPDKFLQPAAEFLDVNKFYMSDVYYMSIKKKGFGLRDGIFSAEFLDSDRERALVLQQADIEVSQASYTKQTELVLTPCLL
jgi:hypothetical protein